MNISETADALHQRGHEVAAAALRRSQMWDPKDIAAFRAIKVRRGFVDTYRRMNPGLHRSMQPGRVELHHPETHDRGIYHGLRVGKHIGPVTFNELQSLPGMPARAGVGYAQDHPLATEGHGLHSSDPAAESFRLLRQHIHDPSVWPIIADHFEEHGGHRAAAMAKLLRMPGHLRHLSMPRYARGIGIEKSPITWPIPVYHPHHDERHVGTHTIDIGHSGFVNVPQDELHEIIKGLR
jgi:hypothetical protein